jgi:hypothetical protein
MADGMDMMRARRAALLGLVGLCLATPGLTHAAAARPAQDLHDIGGLWMNDNTLDERLKREGRHRLAPGEAEPPPPAPPSLTPEYQAIYARMRANTAALAEGATSCRWQGMPGIMTYPYPVEFLLTPGRITMVFEADSQVRRIWLDRTKHLAAEDLDPGFYGDSIGHWEGETLVVDTIGFNDQTTVRGAPHSDQMHVVERIRHTAKNTLEDVITITDSRAFTKPFTMTVTYGRRPDWRIHEYSCNENNRDAPNASGQRSGGVTAPAGAPR